MKKKEKIENTLMYNNMKLVLSYGEDENIIPMGVFKFSEIVLGENSKTNKKGHFISGDSLVVFERLINSDEKIIIPVKDWVKFSKYNYSMSLFNSEVLGLQTLEYIVRNQALIDFEKKSGIEDYLEFAALRDSDKELNASQYYGLDTLNAAYMKNEAMQASNYSVIPVIYNDAFDYKEDLSKTMK